ncbi:MAG: lysophospholipid acyltransferase family protein [Phocaeicola sp.]
MSKFTYYVVGYSFLLISLLPLRLFYIFSDILFYIVFYMARYRREVVYKNLTNAFPTKSQAEIRRIEKKFYAFFCDYIVETLKFASMSKKEIRKRMTFEGIEAMEQKMVESGQSAVVYLGHYGNWEWITSLGLHVRTEHLAGQIYHPLQSPIADKLFLKLRGRCGTVSITMANTLRKIITLRKEKQPFIIGFISDQAPLPNSIHHWINFLNQDTSVFTGTEKIAKQTDSLVYYGHVSRPKRGYYHCRFELLTDAPKNHADFEITDLYFEKLAKDIEIAPQYWLWSHNRWKRTRTNIHAL